MVLTLHLIYNPIDMKQPIQTQNKNQKPPSFVDKLGEILSEPINSHIISWSQDGKSFEIKNLKRFEDCLLPRYFRHSRMSSFVRQLNMYGFHKRKTNKDLIIFSHESFYKGNLENAIVIRKPQGQSTSKK